MTGKIPESPRGPTMKKLFLQKALIKSQSPREGLGERSAFTRGMRILKAQAPATTHLKKSPSKARTYLDEAGPGRSYLQAALGFVTKPNTAGGPQLSMATLLTLLQQGKPKPCSMKWTQSFPL